MIEKFCFVEPVKIYAYCDGCDESRLEFIHNVLMSSPPQYQHICKSCGNFYNLEKIYPFIDYIEDSCLHEKID